jgi:diketogulonate reductase-like aldo/keto reductase
MTVAVSDVQLNNGVAWSPLGQGHALTHPVVVELAERHGRTPAQVVLRWHPQLGNVVIPSRRTRPGSARTSPCSTSC